MHPELKLSSTTQDLPTDPIKSKRGLTPNDLIKVTIDGDVRPNKNLIIISWGPDTKWVARTL